jgi:hypothetical protein
LRLVSISYSQSPAPNQFTIATGRPETRANAGFRVVDAHRQNREQREKVGGSDARSGGGGGLPLTGERRGTAPTLAFRAKKIPTDKSWDFKLWWSWGELNPRPQAFVGQVYTLSWLIWI